MSGRIPIRGLVRILRDAVGLGGRGDRRQIGWRERLLHVAVGLDAGLPLVDEGVVVELGVEVAATDQLGHVAGDGQLVGRVQDVFARLLALVEALELDAQVRGFFFESL